MQRSYTEVFCKVAPYICVKNLLFRQSKFIWVGPLRCYVYLEFHEYMLYTKVFILICDWDILDTYLIEPWGILHWFWLYVFETHLSNWYLDYVLLASEDELHIVWSGVIWWPYIPTLSIKRWYLRQIQPNIARSESAGLFYPSLLLYTILTRCW